MEASAEGITAGIEIPDDDTKAETPPRKTRARKKDAAPKRKPPKPPRGDVTTQAIEDALAQILQLPAVPCAMAGDEWAATHFTEQGRVFAKNLAVQSEHNPTLRRWCERALEGEAIAVLFISGIMYAVPPLIHWGLVPMPDEAKGMLGIPVREATTANMNGNAGNGSNGETETHGDD